MAIYSLHIRPFVNRCPAKKHYFCAHHPQVHTIQRNTNFKSSDSAPD